jgi:hypothetical protein
MTGRLVGAASLAQMMTTAGDEGYGLGIVRRQLAGRAIWSHTGEIRGFASVAVHDVAGRFSVVLIANENPAPVTVRAPRALQGLAGVTDLAVGADSHWRANPKPLDAAQQERVAALQAALKDCGARFQQVLKEINDGLGDAAGEARDRLYSERYTARQSDFQAISKDRSAAQQELDKLVPPRQRKSFVWLYENLAAKKAAAPAK